MNEPQVWVFLFLFFAFLPLSIYYYAFKLYLEDTFNRNRTSIVQAFQRELASFGSRSRNSQLFQSHFQEFKEAYRRNFVASDTHAELVKNLMTEIPDTASIIIWDSRGRVLQDSLVTAPEIGKELQEAFVDNLLQAYENFSAGTDLQTLHQIRKFEFENQDFAARMVPLLGHGFPTTQAFTSPGKVTGGYSSTAEVYFYWSFFNNSDNSLGGFATIVPLKGLSPVFGLNQAIAREQGSSPENSFGFFDQSTDEIVVSYQPLQPIARSLIKKFADGLANPYFAGDWAIFVYPHPDSSAVSTFMLMSTAMLRESFDIDLKTGRLVIFVLLLSAVLVFYHYYRLTITSGMSLRQKLAALFFLCMQLPVSILIFLGIRFSISQRILLNHEAENRLAEMIRKVDSDTSIYYRGINEWLKSLKSLPEMRALDKQKLRETFFRFVRNNQLESFYLINADGSVEFDIDNLAGDNAGNHQFIKELGQHILVNSREETNLTRNLQPLDDGLFDLVTRRTGTMHQVYWPGGETRKFIFSDLITTSDGRKLAAIATISKTELDRKYLKHARNLQTHLDADSEIIILKEDDISDTMPRLSPVFKAHLLPLIAASSISSGITADLLPDETGPMLVAVGRGAVARDFLIGARHSWKKVMETIHLTYALVGTGLFFSLISSLALVTILIKEFLAPVSVLSNGARAISNGDLELNLPVFAKDELGELSTIFNQMTRRLRNRLTELTVLYNLTQKASSTHSQREIFELAAENLQQHLNAESAGTVWVGRAGNENDLYLSENLEQKISEAIKSCARTALKTIREVTEVDSDGRHILSLPLSFEDRKFGAIYLIFSPDRFKNNQGFSDDEKNFMNTLRHHLGLIIENQRLFEEAITDSLTKLYLRRFFLAALDKEISRAKRYQLDLGILLLDIDNFKKFNDTYGHQAGDHVLHETAQRLVENIRAVDTPGRYGGEEIALLLPQTGIKETYIVAERIRKSIENAEYNFRNASMKVTVSIGISSLHMRNVSMEQLIEEADQALYAAKSKGRNQVRIAPEAM